MRFAQKALIFLSLAAACLWRPVPASAADFKVIANQSVGAAALTAADLKAVFLGAKTSLADGSHVEPVLLKSGAAHDAFLKLCLGKTEAALETYYRSLVFTGKGAMPKALGADGDVISYVAKTHGAIGYVSSTANTSGVKILEIK